MREEGIYLQEKPKVKNEEIKIRLIQEGRAPDLNSFHQESFWDESLVLEKPKTFQNYSPEQCW